jgi:toxin ParE1/3/4
MKLIFHSWASKDISSTVDYYNHERDGLGAEFLTAVVACLDTVRHFPDSAPIYVGRYRRTQLRRFPYAVIYWAVGNEIRVMAVTHVKRKPETILDRLE